MGFYVKKDLDCFFIDNKIHSIPREDSMDIIDEDEVGYMGE